MLTQELAIFFSGENFRSLPRQFYFAPQWCLLASKRGDT
ncbi:hypothetical protein PORCRE_342 [Porphyromonas crevioricanis JCM 15906]|uniref:Uncharacterized protein n=1 Tax=Porphyromonas crevioricanis JCM 15906 TaxID=1305617 RepID=T1CLZ8_9PORP|nr:hypothetical protein PORCRE_342 [Porphyromonas crevioricanis JCM 15906]